MGCTESMLRAGCSRTGRPALQVLQAVSRPLSAKAQTSSTVDLQGTRVLVAAGFKELEPTRESSLPLPVAVRKAQELAQDETGLPGLDVESVTDHSKQRNHQDETAAVGSEELLVKLKVPDIRQLFQTLMEEGLQSGQLASGADVLALKEAVSALTAGVLALKEDVSVLTAGVLALKEDVSVLTAATGSLRITNLASQVLLHAIHEFSHDSTSTRFKSLQGDQLKSIRDLAELTGITDTVIINESDQLITMRNKLVHYNSCQQLDQEVQQAEALLQRFPELRTTCWWASWVVLNYRSIKAAFPSGFS